MAEYDLPDGPRQIFEAVREPLAEHLGGERHFRLGDGTALAMRWAHRHSTDVDLFTDSESYNRLWKGRDAFKRAVKDQAGPTEVLGVRRWNTKIILQGGGEITVFTSPAQTKKPLSSDTVTGTAVPLETNSEILARKLWGRMLDSQALLARDLYDFAVARHQDPAAAKTAMQIVGTSDLYQFKNELEALPEGWVHGRDQKSLIQPTYPEEAANPAPFVRDQVWREILSRTPNRPHRPPPPWER